MTGGSPAASPGTSSYEFQTREDPTSCIKAAPLIKLGQKYWNNHFSYGTLLCMLLIHSSCNIDNAWDVYRDVSCSPAAESHGHRCSSTSWSWIIDRLCMSRWALNRTTMYFVHSRHFGMS